MLNKKTLRFGVMAILTLCCLRTSSYSLARHQSGELLGNVIRAHGAHKASSCSSVVLDIDVVLDPQNGRKTNGRIVVKSNRFRLEYEIGPNHKYRMAYDGSQAWLIAAPGAKAAQRLNLLQVGLFQFYSLVFSPRWLGYLQAHSGSLKYGGEQSYRGMEAKILQVNIETIGNVDFLIDANSFLLKAVRFIFPGENQPRYEIVYDSYFSNNGVKIPGTIDIYRNQLHYRHYKVREAKICENVVDTIFAPDVN